MTSSKQAERRAVPREGGGRPNAYARFIPREELNTFAAWAFADIADSAESAGGPTRGPAAREPEPAPVEPGELIAQQLRAARQAGYQDGYRDGLVALEGFKQSFASQTTSQVAALLTGIGAELDALQQEMARSLVATVAALARQVVRSELQARPECVAAVAEQAIDALLLSARHITLRLHPDDQALIAAGAAEAIAARGVRLIGDAHIGRGGCRVESDIGVVDATIEERWRRAAAALGSSDDWTAPA